MSRNNLSFHNRDNKEDEIQKREKKRSFKYFFKNIKGRQNCRPFTY